MKAKVKEGYDLLFMLGNHWNDLTDTLIVNLNDRYTYEKFFHCKNHLFITTKKGLIDIVFTSHDFELEFESYCKDQIIFKIKKGLLNE